MTAPRRILWLVLCLSAAAPCLVRGEDDDPDAPDLPIRRTFQDRSRSFVYDMGFSADGSVLLLTKVGTYTCLWDVESGKRRSGFDSNVGAEQIGVHGVHDFGAKAALSPDGRIVAMDCRINGGTYLGALDADSGKLLQKFFRHGNMIWFVFSPDSTALAAGYDDGGVTRWDMATGKAAWENSTAAPVGSVGTWRGAFAPDGKTVTADFSGGAVRLLDATSGKEIAPLPWPGGRQCQASALAYSPDSRLLAISGCGLQIWDVASAKVTHYLPVGGDTIGFSPDGRTLVLWCRHEPVRLFEVASGKLRREILFPEGQCARISPAACLVALARKGGKVYLCDWRADGRLRPERLKPGEAEGLWEDLASDDAAVAWQAVLALAAAPEQAAEILRPHLRSKAPALTPELERLTGQLDDDEFADREEAMQRLAALGAGAVPALRRALANNPSVELRWRAEKLLGRLEEPESLRRVRAVEALEYAGSTEARNLLKQLASEVEEVHLKDEARAALQRLEH